MEHKYNDYELVYMVRENDTLTRDLLYEKYSPIIKSISKEFYLKYKYYGYEYEDFLQEAKYLFSKAIINYDDSKGSLFYTFVDLCLRRGLLTFCRNISNSKKNKASYYYIDINQCNIPDEKNYIENMLEECDINRIVLETILELPLEDSSILELKFNGFNYREIATLLNIPSTTAEYRVRKIRKKILKHYCKGTI